MPTFDPTLPQPFHDLDANVVRNQLNALKSLIDVIPAPVAETDPIVGAITGIVKADGAGNIAPAAPEYRVKSNPIPSSSQNPARARSRVGPG